MITIDREGLIAKANGSYGIPEAEYERLMGFPATSIEDFRKKARQPGSELSSFISGKT
ncbi:hypothetical protein [Rhizobium bangladeshense]|uniref:hypothetical protein n=1 Tax=Rhizobium bangladeshense TaxID=1138189 RepID=UPI000A4F5978